MDKSYAHFMYLHRVCTQYAIYIAELVQEVYFFGYGLNVKVWTSGHFLYKNYTIVLNVQISLTKPMTKKELNNRNLCHDHTDKHALSLSCS